MENSKCLDSLVVRCEKLTSKIYIIKEDGFAMFFWSIGISFMFFTSIILGDAKTFIFFGALPLLIFYFMFVLPSIKLAKYINSVGKYEIKDGMVIFFDKVGREAQRIKYDPHSLKVISRGKTSDIRIVNPYKYLIENFNFKFIFDVNRFVMCNVNDAEEIVKKMKHMSSICSLPAIGSGEEN